MDLLTPKMKNKIKANIKVLFFDTDKAFNETFNETCLAVSKIIILAKTSMWSDYETAEQLECLVAHFSDIPHHDITAKEANKRFDDGL